MPGHQNHFLAAFIAGSVFCLHAVATHADDPPDESVNRDVTLLFRQLKSDNQALRRQAQRQLVTLGLAAVNRIEREIGDVELDQLPYLISALERMFVAGCPLEAEEAERALERLARSERSDVSGRAAAVLIGHQQLRERRAAAALRELGADVIHEPIPDYQEALLMRPAPFGNASGIVIPGHSLTKIEVWLHHDWIGGEDGLWHVTRFEHNWSVRTWGIVVYNILGNGVSTEAAEQLASRLGKASIQERGSSLGISCDTTYGCLIDSVLPGGTAAQAGLTRGDEILAIDSQPVPTFGHLVAELQKRSMGETAILEVARFGNEPREVEVTLGNWRPVVEARRRAIEEQSRADETRFPNQFPFVPDIPVK